jgi:hypothetical protein
LGGWAGSKGREGKAEDKAEQSGTADWESLVERQGLFRFRWEKRLSGGGGVSRGVGVAGACLGRALTVRRRGEELAASKVEQFIGTP